MPLWSFFVVFIICFVAIEKTKVIEQKWVNVLVSFLVSTIFIVAVGPSDYILTVIPWFAVLIVGVFLVLVLMGFLGKDIDFMKKGVGVGFVVVMILIFIISAIYVFSSFFGSLLPWNSGAGTNSDLLKFTHWLFTARVGGAILLLGLGAVVSWILVKAK